MFMGSSDKNCESIDCAELWFGFDLVGKYLVY